MLAGVQVKGRNGLWELDESLGELTQLARTAGAEVVGQVSQRQSRPDNHYLGRGKLEELVELVNEVDASVLICDDELTPTQQRALENTVGIKVIDRTALILDVFSRHAYTREGQLQVELAQHQYLLPRLAGQWSHLERLGGGIGTRGPGETQLETDRRLIQGHIRHLQQRLQQVRARRDLYRRRRRSTRMPVVSLVGYTNAGKSTLFNALSNSEVAVEDQLFSTLDPVTRLLRLPGGGQCLMADTVGFIQKLSPMVVAAFRATLEELEESDLLLHVIDIAQPRASEQAEVVDQTLTKLGLESKPRLLVINKTDLLAPPGDDQTPSASPGALPEHPSVLVSAARGWNLDGLLLSIEVQLGDAAPSPTPV